MTASGRRAVETTSSTTVLATATGSPARCPTDLVSPAAASAAALAEALVAALAEALAASRAASVVSTRAADDESPDGGGDSPAGASARRVLPPRVVSLRVVSLRVAGGMAPSLHVVAPACADPGPCAIPLGASHRGVSERPPARRFDPGRERQAADAAPRPRPAWRRRSSRGRRPTRAGPAGCNRRTG